MLMRVRRMDEVTQMKSLDDLIIGKFEDLMSCFLYYDRKEDEQLSRKSLVKRLKDNPQMINCLSEKCQEALINATK